MTIVLVVTVLVMVVRKCKRYNCFISQPIHVLWTLKGANSMKRFFWAALENRQQMFELMDKKVFTNLHTPFVFIWTYVNSTCACFVEQHVCMFRLKLALTGLYLVIRISFPVSTPLI